MGTIKITIGIPSIGEIHIETMLCLIYSLNKMGAYQISFSFHKGTYLQELRNLIVQDALAAGSDYLFFLDTDLTFSPDGILKLLGHKKDIIGGAYNMKQPGPPVSTLKMADANGKLLKLLEHPTEDIFKCYSVPTGFMLIRLAAIKNMVNPFDFARNEQGGLIGEDVNFCKRCAEMGLDIWCDPTINIGHIGEYLY